MRWPPNKAWTSTNPLHGFRHFVAINYGGKGANRWVNMISVLDGRVSFRITWDDLRDPSMWICGWKQLGIDGDSTKHTEISDSNFLLLNSSQACFHPSNDSGFICDDDSTSIRPWE